jgi:hypothetical protein
MKKLSFIVLTLLLLHSLTSCGVFQGKDDAEKVAIAFFKDRIANVGGGSDKYYGKQFWQNTDKETWNDIKSVVEKAHGKLKNYSLVTWSANSNLSSGKTSGTTVTLQYTTGYEKGRGTETLILFKAAGSNNYLIVGHNFQSIEIEKLINKGIKNAASDAI